VCARACVHVYESFVSMRFITIIKQFLNTIATNCRALTHCKNAGYIVGHDEPAAFVSVCLTYYSRGGPVRSQVRSCRICGEQSGTGAGFLRVLRFPLPILIPPTAP
jgi:hypothetical protein